MIPQNLLSRRKGLQTWMLEWLVAALPSPRPGRALRGKGQCVAVSLWPSLQTFKTTRGTLPAPLSWVLSQAFTTSGQRTNGHSWPGREKLCWRRGCEAGPAGGGGGPTCPQRGKRDGQGGTVGGGRQGRERVVTDNLGRMIALFKKYFIFIIFYLAVLGLS